MPCFTTIAVELATGKFNVDVLERALRALGFTVERNAGPRGEPDNLYFHRLQDDQVRAARGSFYNGKTEMLAVSPEAGEKLMGELRATYTREAVASAARRHGLKAVPDPTNHLILRLSAGGQ